MEGWGPGESASFDWWRCEDISFCNPLTCRLLILARPTWLRLGPIRGIGPRGLHMVGDFDFLKYF